MRSDEIHSKNYSFVTFLPRDFYEDSQPDRKPNHILIFLDGTWNEERNERGYTTPTNVLRMYQELIDAGANDVIPKEGTDVGGQVIARYYRGVGNRQDNGKIKRLYFGFSGTDEERIRAAAFEKLYSDLKHHTDAVYIIGFSRGAASARLLAQDICKQPLPTCLKVKVCHFSNQLTGQIEARVESVERGEALKASKHQLKIRFLGCWDTVDAFVLPSRYPKPEQLWERTKSYIKRSAKYVCPRAFGTERFRSDERGIPTGVGLAVHCVAIDETRNAFLPTLMPSENDNVLEVWFPGVHANIGGGYENKGLSEAPYQFMKAQLLDYALGFDKDTEVFVYLRQQSNRDLNFSSPKEHCFHFHGLQSSFKKVNSTFGFGTAIRRIHALSLCRPKIHASTLKIMSSGNVFAITSDEKTKWRIQYNGGFKHEVHVVSLKR
jgi:Uncharacterized alpha/beta hydrolase domain (DUF2235)